MHYTVKEKTDINNYSMSPLFVNRVTKMALERVNENTRASPLPYMVVATPRANTGNNYTTTLR